MPLDVTQQAEFVGQITRHQSMLRAYIISLMPGMDGVDDVLQETNLVLFEKFATFQPGTNCRAWACAIARLELKTHRRKLLRQGCLMLDETLAEQMAGRWRSIVLSRPDCPCIGRLPMEACGRT